MKKDSSRRHFLKTSIAATLAAPIVTSFEEQNLLAQQSTTPVAPTPATPNSKGTCPTGKIGNVTISRLICGGNLISGYAHSRDLIYVSDLLKAYFTNEKIMQTWALCEEHGINTMICDPVDPHAVVVYKEYRKRGGKIQYIAQLGPETSNIRDYIRQAIDSGASAIILTGNRGDLWTRENKMDSIARFIDLVKAEKVPAGIAGHELRTVMAVEKAGIKPDFYMKTFHSKGYWSKQRPDQKAEIIDNYATDNYWCSDPDAVIRFMQEFDRPWIAYKVLAAGAISPAAGFKFAYENGADFCVVGMFDFQVAADVKTANDAIAKAKNRERSWCA